jgi:hypothetical protein
MALQDKIGRQEIVDKICGLVDSLQKDQNFCLSINGAWGSGKSFVLQMIEERLVKKQEYVVIKYDAWANSFYSDSLISILSCVIDGIKEKMHLVEKYKEKAKKAAKASANMLASLSTRFAKLQDAVKGISEIIKGINNPIDADKIDDFISYQQLLNETKEVLNEITQKGEYREKQTKMILLVDEIDRCLPDEQLKTLERLHHLFDIKNCAVIVAMNQASIAQTVNTIYGINGNEYLRKFFNFTYRLETSAAYYLKSLLLELATNIDKLRKSSQTLDSSIAPAYLCLLYSRDKVLEKIDNREISRYYDALVNICNDFGWKRLTSEYLFFIVIGLFIRKNISNSFLDEEEIVENQKASLENIKFATSSMYDESEMPYYDYIENYLGLDRQDLPDEIFRIYGLNHCNIIELSWGFSEIVHFSLGKAFNANEMRRFLGQPMVKSEECKELRELIILYGGEQER